jgi:oxygen-independent coproporphyrinogen-3 oxidase
MAPAPERGGRNGEVLVSNPGHGLSRLATRAVRRHLVGPDQRWVFTPPPADWMPHRIARTSIYLHVPFCRNCCPYCPYTKVPYDKTLVERYTKAALAEIDWWADAIGPAEVTSVYIGGGTPTLVLGAVAQVLVRVRERFHVTGDIGIETNPAEVDHGTVRQLHDAHVALVSLGVQSFRSENLATIGRGYEPPVAERALALLAESGFLSVNADIMFALPGQAAEDVTADLARAAALGANQLTTYPLFTFPYTSVGEYLRLTAVRMPDLRVRRAQYRAIGEWCTEHGFERVSVWSFRRRGVPRYSSVTRDGYIGIGPGAGSHLPDGFVLNTFDLDAWIRAALEGRAPIALRMPFDGEMSGWWWLYWRFYDTCIPLRELDAALGDDALKARRWLTAIERAGFAVRHQEWLELTEPGAFWLHLVQNHFALNYVNRLWTEARREPWPQSVAI